MPGFVAALSEVKGPGIAGYLGTCAAELGVGGEGVQGIRDQLAILRGLALSKARACVDQHVGDSLLDAWRAVNGADGHFLSADAALNELVDQRHVFGGRARNA